MILKPYKANDSAIAELEHLLASAPASTKDKISSELKRLRAGIKGEQDSAYHIDFEYANSKNYVVLHDLRFEVAGRVAQIDHLMINRLLDVFVLESKHFNEGIKITEEGEFLRWSGYKKSYEGMPSPLAQNERHIQVLKDVFGELDMPSRLGVRLRPSFQSYVLVATTARVDRPAKFDTSRVIKADGLSKAIEREFDRAGVTDVFGGLAKIVSLETIQDIGRQLLLRHTPITVDYAGKFGLRGTPSVNPVSTKPTDNPQPEFADKPLSSSGQAQEPRPDYGALPDVRCRACGEKSLTILYGKYGYYFKCSACGGNTPIRLECGGTGHKPRLRKDGNRFFMECPDCRSSDLYFQNQAT